MASGEPQRSLDTAGLDGARGVEAVQVAVAPWCSVAQPKVAETPSFLRSRQAPCSGVVLCAKAASVANRSTASTLPVLIEDKAPRPSR